MVKETSCLAVHSVAQAIRMWSSAFRRVLRVHESLRTFLSVSSPCEHSLELESSKYSSTTSTFLPPFAPRSLRVSQLLWRLCLPHAFHMRVGVSPISPRELPTVLSSNTE